MANSVKVDKQEFEDALRKLIASPPIPLKTISPKKTARKKRRKSK